MVRRSLNKVTRWDAPPRLAVQLEALERNVNLIEEERFPSKVTVNASNITAGNKRALVVPDRDVDLSEAHRLDKWVVHSTDLGQPGAATTELYGEFQSLEVTSAVRLPTATAGNFNHPGVYGVTSSASANSGVDTAFGAFSLGGDEYMLAVFRTPASFAGVVTGVGFYESSSMTEPNNGVYLWLSGSGVFAGKNAVAGVRQVTATTVTLLPSTWYTALVKIAPDKSSAVFRVYDDSGVLLWTENVSGNIPANTPIYAGLKQGSSTAGAKACGEADFLEVRIGGPNRPLVRYLGSREELFT